MKNRSGGGRNEETAYDTAVNCEPTKDRAVRERGRGKKKESSARFTAYGV